jgi:hypothetical protein
MRGLLSFGKRLWSFFFVEGIFYCFYFFFTLLYAWEFFLLSSFAIYFVISVMEKIAE